MIAFSKSNILKLYKEKSISLQYLLVLTTSNKAELQKQVDLLCSEERNYIEKGKKNPIHFYLCIKLFKGDLRLLQFEIFFFPSFLCKNIVEFYQKECVKFIQGGL